MFMSLRRNKNQEAAPISFWKSEPLLSLKSVLKAFQIKVSWDFCSSDIPDAA